MNSAFVSQVTNGAEFSFNDRTHSFPDTKEGVLLKHDFSFKNTGDAPLIIEKYEVACSCTKIKYPNKPIMPGESAVVQLSFDTNGKYGFQKRKIDIHSNASKRPTTLTFKVYVIND